MTSPLGIWGDICEGKVTADPLERRAYSQGQSQDDRDRMDGERDALRVLAGLEPLRRLNDTATPAYVEGWTSTVEQTGALA